MDRKEYRKRREKCTGKSQREREQKIEREREWERDRQRERERDRERGRNLQGVKYTISWGKLVTEK